MFRSFMEWLETRSLQELMLIRDKLFRLMDNLILNLLSDTKLSQQPSRKFGEIIDSSLLLQSMPLTSLSEQSGIPMGRLREINKGDRPTPDEVMAIAPFLRKPDNTKWESGELLFLVEQEFLEPPQNIGELVISYWDELAARNLIPIDRLVELRDNAVCPSEVEIIRLSQMTGLSESFIRQLLHREHHGNGHNLSP